MHPQAVVYLEHDGKLLLVNEEGHGPQDWIMGRQDVPASFRFPTIDEVTHMGIKWDEERQTDVRFSDATYTVIHGHPHIEWPEHWAWKDKVVSDDAVHPVVREAVYRSLHRLVSKVIIRNEGQEILMAKVERGFFKGYWGLPGGYMNHSEEPAEGCVRETEEELGITVMLEERKPVITQRSFFRDGVSFMSFTYCGIWNGKIDDLTLKKGEIAEAKWFSLLDAIDNAASEFDRIALESLQD
ncbi:MAG: NUDIX hydrolase [Candidatus Thermoplasmatota archaeon]|nr:NUDIX hydrolase [Candidatus Thermoplasmatota archaeon]